MIAAETSRMEIMAVHTQTPIRRHQQRHRDPDKHRPPGSATYRCRLLQLPMKLVHGCIHGSGRKSHKPGNKSNDNDPYRTVKRYEVQSEVHNQQRQSDDNAGNTQWQKGERIKKLPTRHPVRTTIHAISEPRRAVKVATTIIINKLFPKACEICG